MLTTVDARPISDPVDNGGMSFAKNVGAIGLIRYDPGPIGKDTIATWCKVATNFGLKYILQGDLCDAQGYEWWNDPNVIRIDQPDEPDLNRWDTSKPRPDLYFTPDDVTAGKVHRSMVGWTRPEILMARYKSWKLKKPDIQIGVNFNGSQWTSEWLIPANALQNIYASAFDVCTCDNHVINNGRPIAQLLHSFRRIKQAYGSRARGAYVEASFQNWSSKGRLPTTAEISTEIWGLLAYGASEIHLYPQRMAGPFRYQDVEPNSRDMITAWFKFIQDHANIFDNVTPTITENPPFFQNPEKGIVTFPKQVTARWTLGKEEIYAEIDITGANPPAVKYTKPETDLETATRLLSEANAKIDTLSKQINTRDATIALMQTDYQNLTVRYQNLEADHVTLQSWADKMAALLQQRP